MAYNLDEISVLQHQDKSYVIHTNIDDVNEKSILRLLVTDGTSVWLAELSAEDRNMEKLGHSGSLEEFTTIISDCLRDDKARVDFENGDETLTLNFNTTTLQYPKLQLQLQSPDQGLNELKTLLLSVSTKYVKQSREMKKLNREVELLRRQQPTSDSDKGLMNFGAGLGGSSGKGTFTKARNKVGMSVINPGSKKLKTSRGVEFE